MPDGTVMYPRFTKNTQGEWELKNAAFWSSLIELQKTSHPDLDEHIQSADSNQGIIHNEGNVKIQSPHN